MSSRALRILSAVVLIFAPAGALQAAGIYWSTLESNIFTNASYGCSSCHGTTGSCTGGQSSWRNYASAAACVATIKNYTDINYMPYDSGDGSCPVPASAGGPYSCLSATHKGNIATWDNDGEPFAAPSASSLTEISIDNNSATIRASIDTNVWSGTSVDGSYTIEYGPTTSYGTVVASGTRSETMAATLSGNTGNVLDCGTLYFTRARARNGAGGANVSTVTGSFTTSNCSAPIINFSGAGTAPGTPRGVAKGTTFTQADLTLSVTEPDDPNYSWSFGTPSSGSFDSTNASTGAFTYRAPNAAGTATFTLTVTDDDPFTPGGAPTSGNSDTVTVFVQIVDNPPEFKNAPAGATITSQNVSVSEGDGASPSVLVTMYAEDADGDTLTWSIPGAGMGGSPPARGTLGAFGSPTGTSNTISYTPNNNVDQNDFFDVRVNDGSADVDLRVNVTVTPVPDNPFAVDDGPIIFDIGVPVTIPVLVNPLDPLDPRIGVDGDVDTGDSILVDASSITASAGGATPAAVTGNTEIRYTSTMTQFSDDSFQYRVIDTTARTSNLATVTMRPRDTDTDGVIDYLDNCAGTANPAQTDTDGDQVINVNTTVDPGGDIGGDACDSDDDGDMISDLDEIANSLDPLDPSDATLDNDGDGINNRDEINAGTNPNSPNLTIDATGYFTPYQLPKPDPRAFHVNATALTASDNGPYRPGDNTITWTPSNSTNADLSMTQPGGLVSNPPTQPFFVRPLLNFAADQVAEEGGTVNVMLTLNGDAPSYPVTVSYSVSGSAGAADYTTPMPASGAVVFNDTTPQMISFTLTAADGADAGETIRFQITGATNAALGAKRSHTVTIIEDNVAPRAALQFDQGAGTVVSAVAGPVNVTVVPSDVNAGQIHTFDWSGTDNFLTPPAPGANPTWTTPALTPGNYVVEVRVTDNGSPARAVTVRRILNVIAAAPVLAAVDTDGDGVDDDVEGFDDTDGDGIPNYLDALDSGAAHLLADQTADIADSFLLETEAGLRLITGGTSQASASYGAMITDTEVEDFGDPSGGASLYPDDGFRHFGGVYDFRVTGMVPGSSARVVIPLQTSIPRRAEFRVYDPARGWGGFVVDGNNALLSARGAPGACPEPGSGRYRNGLNYLDNCLQLLVEDGGPNDNDHAVNGEVADPGTLGARLTDPEIEEVEDGGGQMSVLLLALLTLLGLPLLLRRGTVRRE